MYIEIGHELGEESILWIFRDGKVESFSVINDDSIAHDTVFDCKDGKWEISGRYDPKKLTISMAGAAIFDWPARRVDYVKKKLWKTFPGAIEIKEFR